MAEKDYRVILGFTEQWFALGILTEEDLDQYKSTYKSSTDRNSEHYRYGAFRKYIQKNRPLSENIAAVLYDLGASDPDVGMGQAIMTDVIDLPECPAFVLSKARSSGIKHLLRKVERRQLLTELKSCSISGELFNRCLISGDGVVHRYMIDKINLSREQVEALGERGVNKAIRNLAAVKLKRVTPTLDLNSAYREMAQDEQREAEALAWAEGTIDDVAEEITDSEAETEP